MQNRLQLKWRQAAGALALLGATLLAAHPHAASISWDGGANNPNWHNPLNWSGDQVPGQEDDVTIDGNHSVAASRSVTIREFTLVKGATLTVSGAAATFTAQGATKVEAANIYARQGAQVRLPSLTRLVGGACCGEEMAAYGVGSLLDLSQVTFVDGGYRLSFHAFDGGRVALNSLVEKTLGRVRLHADGPGSRVEAAELRNLAGGEIYVVGAATVEMPKLGSAANLDVEVSRGGVFRPPSLARLAADECCTPYTLHADGAGSLLDLSSLTFANGGYRVSFHATNGGRVAVNGLEEKTLGRVRFQADGPGSRVEAAELRNLAGGEIYVVGAATVEMPKLGAAANLDVEVSRGGVFRPPSLARLAADECCTPYTLHADGAGSLLDLPSLTFVDGGYRVTFHATNGGRVAVNGLEEKTLGRVRFQAEGPGSRVEAAELRNLVGGEIYVVGAATVEMPKLASAANLDVEVSRGGVFRPPSLARLAADECCTPYTLHADGAGSLLDLPSLTFVDGGYFVTFHATNGGRVAVNGLEEKTLGRVRFHADGPGSRVEAAELRNLAGGEIYVVGAATVEMPKLASAVGLEVGVSQGGVFRPPSLTRLAGGECCTIYNLAADGLGSLLDLSQVTVLESGYRLNFVASAAGRVLVPHVVAAGGQTRIRAEGEGSLADFSSLTRLVAGNESGIEAKNKGIVALPSGFDPSGISFAGVTPGITFPVAPQIREQPLDRTVPFGSTATFAVVAEGNQPISYRWQIEATKDNWQNLPGQTGPTLAIANVTFGKEGRYRCLLLNVGGLVITRHALLLVGDQTPPDADGDGLLDAWETQYFGNLSQGPDSDPDNDQLGNLQEQQRGTNPAQADTDGDGFNDGVEVAAGTDPKDAASHPVLNQPARVATQPAHLAVPAGQSASFTVTATGTGPIRYQWFKGGRMIPNATANTLTLAAVQLADVGAYSVLVSNADGGELSGGARLTLSGLDCLPAELEALLVPSLLVEGSVGCAYRIEAADSLSAPNWDLVETLTLAVSPQLWVDGAGIGRPARFYRAVVAE